jgi:hypothetical protein
VSYGVRPAAIVATLAIAGCVGACGADNRETAVRQAVGEWTSALARHDGPRACAALSTDLQRAIARHLLGEGVEGSCNTWAARYVSPRNAASSEHVRITAVRIRGARATVSLAAPGLSDAHVRLVMERGHWRIDDY